MVVNGWLVSGHRVVIGGGSLWSDLARGRKIRSEAIGVQNDPKLCHLIREEKE